MTATTCEPITRSVSPLIGPATASGSLFLIGTAAPVAATVTRIPLLVGQGLRYLAASAILLLILHATGGLRRARPRAADLPRIALLGAVGIAGFTIFFVGATRYADPALVGSVLSATPVLLAIIGPLLRGQRPAAQVIIGSVTVATGTALATGTGSAGPVGVLLCVGALGCEVGFTMFAVGLVQRYGAMITTAYASVSGTIFLLLPALLINGPAGFAQVAPAPDELPALGYLAIMVSIGANLAWYTALPRLGPDRAGLFYALAPVGALVAGLVLHTSSPQPLEWVALAMVITGLLIGLGVVRARRSGRPAGVAAGPAGTRRSHGRSNRRSGRC